MIMKLSADQRRAMRRIRAWWRTARGDAEIRLGGLAGTGKTTLASRLPVELKVPAHRIYYCALTGKATRVLASKLPPSAEVTTIHRLLYRPLAQHCRECPALGDTEANCHTHKASAFCGCGPIWVRREFVDDEDYERPALIVCDEASMVNEEVYADMMTLDVPALFIGDHGQLPPVEGRGIMDDPHIRLERVHRQAADSTILQLAMEVRETGRLTERDSGEVCIVFGTPELLDIDWADDDPDTLMLAYTNRTRTRYNHVIRRALGLPKERPVVGDRVICLRNNWQAGIYNGMTGEITQIAHSGKEFYRIEVDTGEREPYRGRVWAEQFGHPDKLNGLTGKADLWDYGYCLTVHKAQGSEAKRVMLIAERPWPVKEREWRRWLYTGITRAEGELTVIVPPRGW